MGPEHHVAQAFLKQKKQKQATKQTNEKNKTKKKNPHSMDSNTECKYK